MMTKAQIKEIKQLQQKKFREEQGLFIAEGPKVVGDLLNSKFKVKDIFATRDYTRAAEVITPQELAGISALTTPNQVLATFEILEEKPDIGTLKNELVLALDDIRDPGNMGTIIRIADWFGIKHILCSENCVDVYNPKVVQGSMGSIARVNIYSVDLDTTLEQFDTVYGTVLGGKNVYSMKLSDRGVILVGNESRGISDNLIKRVTEKISIPSFSAGADSLNAAIATAVICSEFRRK